MPSAAPQQPRQRYYYARAKLRPRWAGSPAALQHPSEKSFCQASLGPEPPPPHLFSGCIPQRMSLGTGEGGSREMRCQPLLMCWVTSSHPREAIFFPKLPQGPSGGNWMYSTKGLLPTTLSPGLMTHGKSSAGDSSLGQAPASWGEWRR